MSRARTVAHDASETAAAARPAGTGGEEIAQAADADPTAAAGAREILAPAAGEPADAPAGETTTATEPDLPATSAEAGETAESETETDVETETDARTGEPARPRPARRRLPALLLAAAVLLTGAGVWFTLEARATAANPAAANLALTDVGATADVTSAVTVAMNQIFSYSYDRTDVTEKAAAAVLRGAAKDSYDKLFAEVRRKAPEQKLVLTSRVSAIAVQELRNGHARLLVFLDQSAVRADNNATDSAAAQLSVTAEHTDGHWVVTALEPR
ncbi:hypothetical protein AB0F15_33995 [Amycolatopsis sp. NPDC026612]|uniref:hypothetical protein n=1 Tax=Amycolatopsis sp. NPDC026612 TaxID=3155466 RepID=UPI0033C26926